MADREALPVPTDPMDAIVNLAKRRGFAFQSSEIYGGIRSSYDYGPLGVELKNNIKKAWWRSIVQLRDDVVGQDAAIIMAPRVWEASGHLESFSDPLVECTNCHQRFREDHLIEAFEAKHGRAPASGELKCPNCGSGPFTDPRNFNLMFKTFMGPVEDNSAVVWLRPETAQGIFVDFPIIQQVSRKKIPFGIAQIGKAFRNEITPGNFIFRTREFEQMELEFFVEPGSDADWHQRWIDERLGWYLDLGLREENVRTREHGHEELAPTASGGTEKRTVLRFDPRLAPIKVAVLPLSRNEQLNPMAREVAAPLRERWMIDYDDARSIGRRYRRQDEIGTPFCVTVDFDSLTDRAVTVRDRDTMTQDRVGVDRLVGYLEERLPR